MHATSPAVPSPLTHRASASSSTYRDELVRTRASDLNGCRNCCARDLALDLKLQDGDVAQARTPIVTSLGQLIQHCGPTTSRDITELRGIDLQHRA